MSLRSTVRFGMAKQVLQQRFSRPIVRDVVLVGLVLLGAASFLRKVPLQTALALDMGSTDHVVAQGFYPAETTQTGGGFRWTDGDSTVVVPAQGFSPHILDLTLDALRPTTTTIPLTVTFNQQPIIITQQPTGSRHYHVSVPLSDVLVTSNALRIQSTTLNTVVAGERRALGVALVTVVWRAENTQRWLPPIQLLVIACAVIALYVLVSKAGLPFWARTLTTLLFVAILLAMRHSDTRFVYRWHAVVLTGGLAAMLAVAAVVLRRGRSDLALAWRPWLQRHWPAFVGYIIVTGVLQFPLVRHFTTHIVGFPGDSYEFLWKLQWFSDALLRQHVSPVFAPQILYPVGYELAYGEITPAHTLLGVPLTWLWGARISYNIQFIASYILSGFGTYLLAHRLGARRAAAWVAGIIFAFSLRRAYQQESGFLNLFSTQWLPLAWYGWEGVLTRRRMWDGFVTGLGLVLASWASWYYGPTLALLLALYAVVRPGWRNLPRLVQSWRPVMLAGVLTLALVLPVAQPYLELRQQGDVGKHKLIELEVHSSRFIEYFLPNPWHPLWGNWAKTLHRHDGGEHLVALGYSLIALGLLGFRQRRAYPNLARALLVIIVINVVMTEGPYLKLPSDYQIALPAKFVFEHVPILDGIRVWNRMALYVGLCAALLASLGLTALPQRWYRAGWIGAAALVLLECAAAFPLDTARPRPVDVWLQQQPGNGAVMPLPGGIGGQHEYYTLFWGKPTNAWGGSFYPPLYQDGLEAIARFPDITTLRLLQRWHTDYIIVNDLEMKRLVPNWRAKLRAQPLVTEVFQANEYVVYRLKH